MRKFNSVVSDLRLINGLNVRKGIINFGIF